MRCGFALDIGLAGRRSRPRWFVRIPRLRGRRGLVGLGFVGFGVRFLPVRFRVARFDFTQKRRHLAVHHVRGFGGIRTVDGDIFGASHHDQEIEPGAIEQTCDACWQGAVRDAKRALHQAIRVLGNLAAQPIEIDRVRTQGLEGRGGRERSHALTEQGGCRFRGERGQDRLVARVVRQVRRIPRDHQKPRAVGAGGGCDGHGNERCAEARFQPHQEIGMSPHGQGAGRPRDLAGRDTALERTTDDILDAGAQHGCAATIGPYHFTRACIEHEYGLPLGKDGAHGIENGDVDEWVGWHEALANLRSPVRALCTFLSPCLVQANARASFSLARQLRHRKGGSVSST